MNSTFIDFIKKSTKKHDSKKKMKKRKNIYRLFEKGVKSKARTREARPIKNI